MAHGSGPEAAKQPQVWCSLHHTSLLGWGFHVGTLFSFYSYIVLHVLPKQFYFCLIYTQDIFPVMLWSCQAGLWQTLSGCCNVLFGEQWLPSWCTSMDTMPVQCFTYGWLMNGDVNESYNCFSAHWAFGQGVPLEISWLGTHFYGEPQYHIVSIYRQFV